MKTFLLLLPLVLGAAELPCNFSINPAAADPRARWAALGIRTYTMHQRHSCFCPYGSRQATITVRDNQVVSAVFSDLTPVPPDHWSFYKTVDQLFDYIDQARRDSAAYLRIEYDPWYGYPSDLYIDWDARGIDDEEGFHSEGFQRLPN